MPKFSDVTLLITHYNRSSSLERLLKAFSDLDCHFGDIVVSDDGSRPEHLEQLSEIHRTYPYRLVSTPVNRGLGNNINKGQDAVKTTYTLYVQEDFVPKAIFPANLTTALKFLQQRSDLDVIRFYAYFKYPYLKSIGQGFSEMVFRFSAPGYKKFYYYSDHPHLRRTSFFEKFGRYPEGIKVEATEYKMMISFLKNKGKALQFDDPSALFDQLNSSDEPSTVSRNKWRVNNNPLIVFLRHLYRHIKFNYDYLR
ncbi:glycosyl transferase family 2 [Dyadobacter luteus]|uniref:Glycosyl transferase family 2 n=1 Tax=Dyadobacter luteus TaxID=2259619 RepID=A0A3D8Y7H7_9BACT|nr:glycosyltransferase [Dyadobacter luteus]REA57061.1 glycosyl transferase family 2 [Dyadobacter luteus]